MGKKQSGAARAATIDRLEPRQLFASVPPGFVAEPWGGRVEDISAIGFAPDGRLFALSQPGGVYVIGADGTQAPGPALQLDVASEAEQGLSGIAFDPDFETDPWVYLYYTRPLSETTFANEIARFRVAGDAIDASSKQVLLTLDPVVNAIHNGGAMAFGPDGKLYVGVGDGAVSSNAQSVTVLQGKILRINKDGSIPDDNPTDFIVRPTGGSGAITVTPSGVYRAIYAMGMRNPFSLDFNSATGELIAGDVGQEDWEELNVVRRGANYGWPATRDGGFDPATFPEMTAPIYSFAHGTGNTLGNAVVGATYYSGSDGPNGLGAEFDGKLFFGEFDGDGWINYIDPASPPADNNASLFATGFAGMVDMEVGPDGALYVTQRWNQSPGVTRINPNNATPPRIVQQPQHTAATVGEPVTFRVGATGQAPLRYQWYRDNVAIEGATGKTYTLASPVSADGGALFHVIVSNDLGAAQSDTVTLDVSTNAAPVPTIIAPAAAVKAAGGVRIDLSGIATDAEDGDLAGASLTWKVDYYTGGLQRPFVAAFSGDTGSFTPHTVTPYLDTDVFYRVTLTATDSQGRSSSVSRDVQPLVVTTTLRTSPAGGPLFVNGSAVTSPFSFQSVAGVEREIEAPLTFTLRDQTFAFDRWNTGPGRFQTITIPRTDSTFTATYADTTPLVVESVEIDTSTLPWRAVVSFSENILGSVDLYDFGMSGPERGYIPLPTRPILFDAANNRVTLELATADMPAGQYTLNIYPAGLTDAIGIPLAAGSKVEFDYQPPPTGGTSTLHGRVFYDTNADGRFGAGESYAVGMRVWLDTDGNGLLDAGERTMTTYGKGEYDFDGLTPGTYSVRLVLLDGYEQTFPAGATVASVVAGQTYVQVPYIGLRILPTPTNSEIAGIIFDDRDRSGWRDENEPGRAGATLFLDTDDDGVLDPGEATAVADSGGYYEFGDVPTGTYRVRADRGELIQTSPTGDGARVAVIDARDQFRFVGDIGLSVPAAPPLPTPSDLAGVGVGPYLVRLDWLSDATNVLDFIIERRTLDGEWSVINDVVERRSRTYNDWSVDRGVTYVYRVRAKGAAGVGEASGEITVTSA
ncbi:MAG TPA: PQQ-dependent sugar dehydrogenase [Tepidisphaeraceae bacterium]|jgi:glucose/arabinose dehydrogenase